MSTAADYDQPYDDDDYRDYGHACDARCPAGCGYDEPDGPPLGSDPGIGELLDGPAVDALYGLRQIRDVPPAQLPAGLVLQAILAAQRLTSWAKAQTVYWTAAFARPGVAVPVSNLLDSIAHRADEQGRRCEIPDELVERAAAGHAVFGDPEWDAVLASEAASFAEPELSAAWLIAPITARRRIADAQELVDELPATFRALEEGRVEEVRARVIAETTHHIDPGLRARAEQLILDRAKRGMSPGDLGRLAKKIVADVDPEAAGRRAEKARAGRGTGVRDLGDDMARFSADLAVEDAALTEALLDLLAAAVPTDCRQGRGISQLRADIFADLFGQLADTGLIDLRGINPDSGHAGPTGPDDPGDPDDLAASTAGPAAAAEPGRPAQAADTDHADTAADVDPDDDTDNAGSSPADTDNTGPAGSGPSDPANSDRADLDPDDRDSADPDTAQEAAADTAEPEPGQGDPTGIADADTGSTPEESTPEESSPEESSPEESGPPEPGPVDEGAPGEAPESAAEARGPTAAELWARLRSVDWESHLDPDPDCERRGGLLSMIRLPAGLRVNLDVTIALSTLAGHDDLSARLAGLGVITADTARALAKAAGTVRILVTNDPPGTPRHGPPPTNGSPPGTNPGDPDPGGRNHGGIHHDSPDCGSVLDFGRTVYRPPASVIDRVDTRDRRCRFPGCPQPAPRCDHDHRTTWDDGGATCPCDLDALCPFHHRAKTFTTWSAVRDHSANTMTWTSPLGRIHADRPAPDLPTGTPLNLAESPVSEPAPGDEPVAGNDDIRGAVVHDEDLAVVRDPDDPPF